MGEQSRIRVSISAVISDSSYVKTIIIMSFRAVGWQKYHCYEFMNSLEYMVLQNVS
jgi:hypothetical protein